MGSFCFWLLLSLVAPGLCSEGGRYKIVLQQNGFAQFLQYDVATPPMRGFTLCMWMKLYDFQGTQTILTYLGRGNNRIVKIWLEPGAQYLVMTIKGYTMPKVLINLGKNTWYHFCISYQAEYGAYALYMNGDLLLCEATEKLVGYMLPAGGSLIIGYGMTLEGKPTGLSGEIYGVNMIAASTIVINASSVALNTIKPVDRNRATYHHSHIKYTVLDEIKPNETNYYSQIALQDHNDHIKYKNHRYSMESYNSRETKDNDNVRFKSKTESTQGNTRKLQSKNHNTTFKHFHSKHELRFDSIAENNIGLSDVSASKFTEVPLSLVQYEVPPPLLPKTTLKPTGFYKREKTIPSKFKKNKPELNMMSSDRAPNLPIVNKDGHKIFHFPVTNTEINTDALAQHVVPPPPEPFTKTLNGYSLKETHDTPGVKSMKKKSTKNSTHTSYVGEISELERPPPPMIDTKVYGQWTAFTHNGKFSDFLKHPRHDNRRVPPTIPLITVSETFPYPPYKMATNLVPNNVNRRVFYKREASNPEINVKIVEDNIRSIILEDHANTKVKNVDIINRGHPKDYRVYRDAPSNSIDNYDDESFTKDKPLFVELPFLKALEYYQHDFQHSNLQHNSTQRNVSIHKDTYPSPTIKDDITFITSEGPITNYNNIKNKHNNWKESESKSKYVFKENLKNVSIQNDKFNPINKGFDRNVKLGNALNERFVIGKNLEQKKRSFEGGDDSVPDIQRYRSDIDKVNDNIPNSVLHRACYNIELLDLSIRTNRKTYRIASEFILLSLTRDSVDESDTEDIESVLYINWHKTPVRLFGGARAVKEKDICIIIKCNINK